MEIAKKVKTVVGTVSNTSISFGSVATLLMLQQGLYQVLLIVLIIKLL